MNERITLVSLFNKENLDILAKYERLLNNDKCKVPYGKNVDDRIENDTLPSHFTLFSWSIQREKEILLMLENIDFKPIKVLINAISVIEGHENSFELRFDVFKSKELYELQSSINRLTHSDFFNPDKFIFHITLDISKDKNRIFKEKEILDGIFIPFELEVEGFGLYEIYPAKLIKEFK